MPDHLYKVKEQLFAAKTLYRELKQNMTERPADNPNLLFNDLVQLAKGNPTIDAQMVLQKINQSLVLRRQYLQLLQNMAFASSPVQAAASTTDKINSRQSAEFELLFKPDKEFAGQVYVILKIPHPTEHQKNHGVRINCCSENLISTVLFPSIVDGKTQLLMEESDKKFIHMFDADFALYLA